MQVMPTYQRATMLCCVVLCRVCGMRAIVSICKYVYPHVRMCMSAPTIGCPSNRHSATTDCITPLASSTAETAVCTHDRSETSGEQHDAGRSQDGSTIGECVRLTLHMHASHSFARLLLKPLCSCFFHVYVISLVPHHTNPRPPAPPPPVAPPRHLPPPHTTSPHVAPACVMKPSHHAHAGDATWMHNNKHRMQPYHGASCMRLINR